MTYYSIPPRSDELYHYGIKGMRWGVRRYQNEDGSLTPAGVRHYYRKDGSITKGRHLKTIGATNSNNDLISQLGPRGRQNPSRKNIKIADSILDEYFKRNPSKTLLRYKEMEKIINDHKKASAFDQAAGYSLNYERTSSGYKRLSASQRAERKELDNEMRRRRREARKEDLRE